MHIHMGPPFQILIKFIKYFDQKLSLTIEALCSPNMGPVVIQYVTNKVEEHGVLFPILTLCAAYYVSPSSILLQYSICYFRYAIFSAFIDSHVLGHFVWATDVDLTNLCILMSAIRYTLKMLMSLGHLVERWANLDSRNFFVSNLLSQLRQYIGVFRAL